MISRKRWIMQERENRDVAERLAASTSAIEIASIVEYKQAHLAVKQGRGR
jgi:hypothetical protein